MENEEVVKDEDFYTKAQRQIDELIETEKKRVKPDTRVILDALKLKAELQDKKVMWAKELVDMSKKIKDKKEQGNQGTL